MRSSVYRVPAMLRPRKNLSERRLRRIRNRGLKGVTARLAFPKVPYAALIDVLRPIRHEQLLATLGAFDNRIWA